MIIPSVNAGAPQLGSTIIGAPQLGSTIIGAPQLGSTAAAPQPPHSPHPPQVFAGAAQVGSQAGAAQAGYKPESHSSCELHDGQRDAHAAERTGRHNGCYYRNRSPRRTRPE